MQFDHHGNYNKSMHNNNIHFPNSVQFRHSKLLLVNQYHINNLISVVIHSDIMVV